MERSGAKQKKPPFSDREMDDFKKLILQKRAQAREELAAVQSGLDEMKEMDDDEMSASTHHMADVGSKEQGTEMAHIQIERLRAYIEQLDSALMRIENGTYGICRATGKPIEKERLEAVPHTRYSMEAKQKGLDKEDPADDQGR